MRLVAIAIIALFHAGISYAQEICTVLSTTCTETGSVEFNGYVIDGVCITQSVVHECITERENDLCGPLEADSRCEFTTESCLENADGICVDFEKQYTCIDGELEYPDARLISRNALSINETWDYSDCNIPDQSQCTLEEQSCVEGEETRTINGFEFTRDCWRKEQIYSCSSNGDLNSCTYYEDNPDCTEVDETCLAFDNGVCTHSEVRYSCAVEQTETIEGNCVSDTVCIGDECTTYEDETDTNFTMAQAWLQFLHEASQDHDVDTDKIFTGRAMICRKKGFGWKNCCSGDGWGLGGNLAACRDEEWELIAARTAKRTVYVASWCVQKIFGYCISSRQLHCSFNSKIARIIHEQGRPMINRDFGGRYDPDCDGLTVSELEFIDMEEIDLSEIVPDIDETNLTSEEYLQAIMDRLQL